MNKQEAKHFLDAILPSDKTLDMASKEAYEQDNPVNCWFVTGYCACVKSIRIEAERYLKNVKD